MSGPSSPAAPDANEKLNVEGDDRSIRWSFKNDSCVVRVDVPGCSGLPVPGKPTFYDFHPNYVAFALEEQAMDQTDRSRRTYNGYVKFDPMVYDTSKVKVKVVHGVLWITVPRQLVV